MTDALAGERKVRLSHRRMEKLSRSAVQKATYELREELDQMDGRLRSYFSADFIDSLYPELTRKGTIVADEADEDDDTSAPPDGG